MLPLDLNEKMEEWLIEEQMNPAEMIRMRSDAQLKETFNVDQSDKEAVKQFSYIPQMMHNDLGIVSNKYHQSFNGFDGNQPTSGLSKEASRSGNFDILGNTDPATRASPGGLRPMQQSPSQKQKGKQQVKISPYQSQQTSNDFSTSSFEQKRSHSNGKFLQYLEYKNKL